MVSQGLRLLVFEIIDDAEDEDTETKRKVDGQFKKEKDAIFKETIDQAQREAETQSQYSFNQDEVDYDDEEPEDEDVVMKTKLWLSTMLRMRLPMMTTRSALKSVSRRSRRRRKSDSSQTATQMG